MPEYDKPPTTFRVISRGVTAEIGTLTDHRHITLTEIPITIGDVTFEQEDRCVILSHGDETIKIGCEDRGFYLIGKSPRWGMWNGPHKACFGRFRILDDNLVLDLDDRSDSRNTSLENRVRELEEELARLVDLLTRDNGTVPAMT